MPDANTNRDSPVIYTYKCHRCGLPMQTLHAQGSIIFDVVLENNGWSRSAFFDNPMHIFCPKCTKYRRGES